MLLAWAEPRIPIPGPDRDQSDEWEMQVGIKSRINVCMERYGLNHDQAVQRLKEVAEDEEIAKAVLPQELTPPASETMPSEEQDARQEQQADADATRGAEASRAKSPTRRKRATNDVREAADRSEVASGSLGDAG